MDRSTFKNTQYIHTPQDSVPAWEERQRWIGALKGDDLVTKKASAVLLYVQILYEMRKNIYKIICIISTFMQLSDNTIL